MHTLKSIGQGLALAAVLFLGACQAVPGTFNGLSKDSMPKVLVHCSAGPCSVDQYVLATVAATMSDEQVDLQISDTGESIVTSGGAYSVAYGLGGATQPLLYKGASLTSAAGWNALMGFFGGAVNGMQVWSYADVSGVGHGGEFKLRDWQGGDAIPLELLRKAFKNPQLTKEDVMKIATGLHLDPAYVRTHNRSNKPADGLVPDWKGPKVGTTTTDQ